MNINRKDVLIESSYQTQAEARNKKSKRHTSLGNNVGQHKFILFLMDDDAKALQSAHIPRQESYIGNLFESLSNVQYCRFR